MHITILTWVQNGGIAGSKMFPFCQKMYFWSFIFNMKITRMPIACFIFWLFASNALLFSSYVVAYVYTFPS